MNKSKIVHIHTDLKFVEISKIFNCDKFENINIIITDTNNYKWDNTENFFVFTKSKRSLGRIISFCEDVDMVVLYNLNFVKCYIANNLPKKIPILWRFFGSELYGKIPEYVYSSYTLSFKNNQNKNNYIRNKIKIYGSRIKQFIKYNTTYKNEFRRAVCRCNYFLGVSKKEYDFLKERFSTIPSFIQYPFSAITNNYKIQLLKSDLIIIGNNRSSYNNHYDILEIISKLNSPTRYSFLLFFNYGPIDTYSEDIKAKALEIKGVTILEEFLTKKDYSAKYVQAKAFIMNGYRQMAMNNILNGIRFGVKIYLNKKNIIFDWLIDEGFLIFSIDEFISDYKINNINLSKDEILHNITQYNSLLKKYNKIDFQNKLSNIILS